MSEGFDPSEESLNEENVDTSRELDFEGSLELDTLTPEYKNHNEQETGIVEEQGKKNIEDGKVNEKQEDPLIQCIENSRGPTENMKLEYEGNGIVLESLIENIKNSSLDAGEKVAQEEKLRTLAENPEQAQMLPDYVIETVEAKTTYVTAMTVDSKGEVSYKIMSFEEKKEEREEKPIDRIDEPKVKEETLNLELSDIDKQEEVGKEATTTESLSVVIEANNEQEIGNVEEVVEFQEAIFIASEASQIEVEPITVQTEDVIDNACFS